jgi:hypothetical protein
MAKASKEDARLVLLTKIWLAAVGRSRFQRAQAEVAELVIHSCRQVAPRRLAAMAKTLP